MKVTRKRSIKHLPVKSGRESSAESALNGPAQPDPAAFDPRDSAESDLDAADSDADIPGESDPSSPEADERGRQLAEDAALTLQAGLTPADVVASVFRWYPEINQARQAFQQADGQMRQAYGAYDTKLKGHTLSEPTGFYENYRHGIGLARQTWWGGNIAGGYRVGRGVFQPWYLERETETGGEFKLAFRQPLLQGRAIDPERIALFQATLARRAADPILQEAILIASRDAQLAYWNWVAAGGELRAERDLQKLAEERGEQFRIGFEAEKFAEIDVILNNQLIAERRAKTLDSERKFRTSAIKLSLYLRDDAGQPLIAPDAWLPQTFPVLQPLPLTTIEAEVVEALQRRPEPRRLELELQTLNLDARLARNQLLPRLGFIVEGSQDFGGPASSSDDKGEFVLVIGAEGEVPLQRRKARGKLQSTSAKIAEVSEKLRLQTRQDRRRNLCRTGKPRACGPGRRTSQPRRRGCGRSSGTVQVRLRC